jgi:hypothetical protein
MATQTAPLSATSPTPPAAAGTTTGPSTTTTPQPAGVQVAAAGTGTTDTPTARVVLLAAVVQPLTTLVQVTPPAAPGGGTSAATAAAPTSGSGSAVPSTPPPAPAPAPAPAATQPFPVALLNALLNARTNLEGIWQTFEASALVAELSNVVALKSVTDPQSYGARVAALEQADKTYRALRDQKDRWTKLLDENGEYLLEHHPGAGATVERAISEAVQPQAQPNRILLKFLHLWETKAHVGRRPALERKAEKARRKKPKVARKAKGRTH